MTLPYRMTRTHTLLGIACVALVIAAVQGHAGHGSSSDPPPASFHDPKITQDEAHLREHLKDEINVKGKMTPEEMEFHYFRLHDTNNDTHLDGTEIIQAMSHMVPPPELELHEKLGKSKEQIQTIMDERYKGMMKYYEDMIDRVLIDDDVDKNGYLTYSEFVRARRRDEYHQQKAYQEQMMMQQAQFEQFKQFQAMQAQQMQQGQGQGNFRPTPPPAQGGQQQQQQGVKTH